jgi:hypothetical protein
MYSIIRFAFFLFFLSCNLMAQVAPGIYLVEFRDKAHNEFQLSRPSEFLSQRALDRRERQGIEIDSSDLPVTNLYLDSLQRMGFDVLCTSRWLNSAIVVPGDESLFDQLENISFIKYKNKFAKSRIQRDTEPKLEQDLWQETKSFDTLDYGVAWKQIHFQKGEYLHELGYRGKGIQIAVIDAGYNLANILPSLLPLWNEKRIIAVRDFVEPGNNLYTGHSHGTFVLSIMAGNDPLSYLGTAPDASYYLLRSEQSATEYIIEEDFWIAAAEFADSAGADLINTSLGYTLFDDPSQDHSYADMNGSSRISSAADIAFSKGMMVIISAGNEGNKTWRYLSAPSDAVNAICVGASDYMGNVAGFSSRGPASDGRIKPDLISVGWNTWIQNTNGSYAYGSGTSFSAPVITGLTACLWQANPTLTNRQIRECILKSCNNYNSPDSISGYGIPDYEKAHHIAGSLIQWPEEKKDSIFLGPNPFSDRLEISWYDESSVRIEISIYNLSGSCLIRREAKLNPGPVRNLQMEGLDYLPSGIYLLQMDTGIKKIKFKVVKQ